MRRVSKGDRFAFRADEWNSFASAAEAMQRKSHNVIAGPSRDNGGVHVLVRNDTGETQARFNVLAIGDPLIDPSTSEDGFLDRIAFSASTPTEDDVGRFCVLLEPLPPGEIGRAVLHGPTICRVHLTTDGDRYSDCADSQTDHLVSGSSGAAEIIWTAAGEGETDWAIVRIGGGLGAASFTARLTSVAWDGIAEQLRYAWSEVKYDDGAWETVTGGRSGTTSSGYAINMADGAPPIAIDLPTVVEMQTIRDATADETLAIFRAVPPTTATAQVVTLNDTGLTITAKLVRPDSTSHATYGDNFTVQTRHNMVSGGDAWDQVEVPALAEDDLIPVYQDTDGTWWLLGSVVQWACEDEV